MSDALRDDQETSEPEAAAPSDDATSDSSADSSGGPGLGPPTAVESLIGALLEAGPEVAEHVVKAAQELLLAVQVVVDAADQAVQEQKDVRDGRPSGGPAEPEPDASVRHLDLAE
jgi:hypothetical protein